MNSQPIVTPLGKQPASVPQIFGKPSEARIEKIQGGKDDIGRSVLELYFADAPDFIKVNPYDPTTDRVLRTVNIRREKTGWWNAHGKFESGEFIPVDWSIKYRHNKINDIVLLEAVDMSKDKQPEVKTPPTEADLISERATAYVQALNRIAEEMHYTDSMLVLRKRIWRENYDGATLATQVVAHPKFVALTAETEYREAVAKTQIPLPQITQEQLDKDIAATKSDFDILASLKNADIKSDETPSPDVEHEKNIDDFLQRLPNGAPNPDPKYHPETHVTPSENGKEGVVEKITTTETNVSKSEASTPVSVKPLTVEDWTKWEKEQIDNLDIGRADLLKALGIEKYSQWSGSLEEATKGAIGYCNQARTIASAKHELQNAGIPIDLIIQWIAEAGEAPKANDPLSVAEWADPLRKKAMHYNATKPEPERAIVPVETDKPMALTVPSLPMRSIKLPNPDELKLMEMFAKAVAGSKLYRDIDTVDKALVILWKGFELGVSFGAALDGIYIINGRPWPGSMILKAVVDASGLAERFDIINDGSKCRVVVKRKGRDSINEYSYSIDEAKAAGLMNKDTWKNHGKRMIAHRAVRHAVMSEFPDIAAGIGMDFNGDDEEAA